jgi:hypothetical protein
MTGNVWWIGPVVLVLLRLLYAEARTTTVSSRGSGLVFRAATGVLVLLGFGIVLFLILIVKSIGHEEWWVIGMATTLAILLCFAWPGTITIDGSGVAKHVWWKRTVEIPWGGVTQLEHSAGGDWVVYGSDGTTITFSRYHTDPHRFESEVLRRANLGSTTTQHSRTTIM